MNMRQRFLELIGREIEHARAGRPARIVAKMNQLQDVTIGRALVAASQAGVSVDLIVRGFCCLLPGVTGWTDNVRVRSVIGRFLEHSRIFHFANGQADPLDGDYYIGSADWMYRNLTRRVEAVTPVGDKVLRARLWEILDVCLHDRRHAWTLAADSHYTQLSPAPGTSGPEVVGTYAALIDSTRRRIAVPRPVRYGT
jgi:polyphosphate kinase